MKYQHLAIDLGASSGRLILGTIENGIVSIKEVHRFENSMLCINGAFHWNIGSIYAEILLGIEKCVKHEKVQPHSIGIDTWGVDYGLIAEDGSLLGLPFAYRDNRTQTAIDEFSRIIPKEKIYSLTGTLFASYNTLFQLYAAKKYHPNLLNAANSLLFIPDLIAYFLTGKKRTEFSFATTTQLYNPIKANWENEIFAALGIPTEIMQEILQPGTEIGKINKTVQKITGIHEIPLIAVATHDTNSAIAAIPAQGNNWALMSSGTWSVVGMESQQPIINENTYKMNFTNEGGVGGTFNILKNHTGLWLLQECKKSWKEQNYNFAQLIQMAAEEEKFDTIIDTDNIRFMNPADMPQEIANYCKENKLPEPQTHAQYIRCILNSLAQQYSKTIAELEQISGKKIENLYITGGGIQNTLLCQLTAKALGKPVITALAEGTATGNILTQALAFGQVNNLADMRKIVAQSFETKIYT